MAVLEATEVVGRKAPVLSNTTSLFAVFGFNDNKYLFPEPVPAPVTAIPIPVNPPPAVVESVRLRISPLVTCPLPALAVTVFRMAVPEVKLLPRTSKIVAVVAAESIIIVPLFDWLLVTTKFGIVTNPVPKVTGRLVVVLMFRVEAEVRSIIGSAAVKFVVTLLKVTLPVPVAKVLAPVTEVAPLNETLPVPVEKVLAPSWEKSPVSKVKLPEVSRVIPGLAPVVNCKGVAASVLTWAVAPEKFKLMELVSVVSLCTIKPVGPKCKLFQRAVVEPRSNVSSVPGKIFPVKVALPVMLNPPVRFKSPLKVKSSLTTSGPLMVASAVTINFSV